MNRGIVIGIAIIALLIGFGSGFILRPSLSEGSSPALSDSFAQPTEMEATAAVRRHRVGISTFPDATLTLGDCSPGTVAAGVSCMTKITLHPTRTGASAQTRSIGFARVDGQWEVSAW